MFITYAAGDLLDAQTGIFKEIGCKPHFLLGKQSAQPQASALFEQVSQVGLAQVAFEGQFMNRAGWVRFDHLQEFAKTAIVHCWKQRAKFGTVALCRRYIVYSGSRYFSI
jgi:hypothetical protein